MKRSNELLVSFYGHYTGQPTLEKTNQI